MHIKSTFIALMYLTCLSAPCQNAGPSEAEVLAEVQRVTGNDIPSIESLSSLPPKKAWHGYCTIKGFFEFSHPELFKRAGRAIAKNTDVQAMLEEKYKPVQQDYQREDFSLLALGGVPAPWSARILGRYLMDPTPMEPRKGNYDVGTMSNEGYAAWGLSAMNFPGAPTQGAMPLNIGLKLQAWKDWWVANEAHIEDRIREINPEWEPEEVLTQAAESTPKLPVLPSPTQKPMPTATPGIVKSLAQESASPTLIIVIILVAAVGVGVWIYTRGGGKKS